jgi:hypothetical protein
MERRKFVWNGLLFLSTLGLTACQHEYREEPYGRRVRRRGPPPHAPAHGYRHRHRRGVDLVYDSGLGVYVVVGAPRTYYYDGRFYRHRRGDWESSPSYGGHWQETGAHRLPRRLRKRAKKWKDNGRDQDRGARGRGGPPPRAPRHGYRHRYRRGVDLVFDSGLGVYLVAGTPFYYHGGRFYRVHKGQWQSRANHDGSWRRSSGQGLPSRVRRKAGKWKKAREERREMPERSRGRGRRDGY